MKQSTKLLTAASLGLVTVSLMALPAFAHTGGHATGGFAAGFLHPFTGIDHLVAIIGVGVLATLRGGRAMSALPAAFLAAMVLGAILPIMGVAIPGAEAMIVLSLLIVGTLLGLGKRLALPAVVSAVAVFALFHGVAHGTEMAVSVSPLPYVMGFVLAGALILMLGMIAAMLGAALRRRFATA